MPQAYQSQTQTNEIHELTGTIQSKDGEESYSPYQQSLLNLYNGG